MTEDTKNNIDQEPGGADQEQENEIKELTEDESEYARRLAKRIEEATLELKYWDARLQK